MTFNEALNLKEKVGKTIVMNEIVYKIYPCPADPNDYNKFLIACELPSIWSDDKALLYTLNGEFLICGLTYVGGDFIHASFPTLKGHLSL